MLRESFVLLNLSLISMELHFPLECKMAAFPAGVENAYLHIF